MRDLDLFGQPLDDTRYELIGGALHVSKQPHHEHQALCTELSFELLARSRQTKRGRVIGAPGVIFTPEDPVASDIVWFSREREPQVLGADGMLHAAPDLVIEVVSPRSANRQRDYALKLELYPKYLVTEYWVVDLRDRTIAVHRHDGCTLKRVETLHEPAVLESPLMPGIALNLAEPLARLA